MEISQISTLIIGPPGRWRSSVCVLLQANPAIQMVQQADDGAAGLACLADFGAEHQRTIVLVDGGLPGEGSWLALRLIRRTWPQVRVVFLAHDSTQARRAAEAEADAILQVGFSGETLYATLQRLLT